MLSTFFLFFDESQSGDFIIIIINRGTEGFDAFYLWEESRESYLARGFYSA